MTKNWRLTVAIPSWLESRIVALRKQDRFCRMTFSELVRYLVEKGIAVEDEKDNRTA